ncbi:hydroxypyruvate isomerase [Devosia enhydra]|uniref:Hydroxypyruvate isomerase n=1 Tax=Devosia enhydra TaxID=665118 RepID=A0A1K2HWJ6_9HYPH|nr:TIM barrel protein [Devosia enhydra]SFZ83041.1 hydroxypyruvate isomerase [Devosia enhydra]
MPRFSANLGFLWADRPLLARIAAAGEAGFRAIELHYPYETPPQAVRDACAQTRVKLLGINTAIGSEPPDSGLAALPGREAEARARIEAALNYAVAAGGTAVHVMAGKVPSELRAKARQTLISNLRHAAGRAEALGLTILLEPINRRDMPDYFYDGVEDAAAIIAELDSPAVRLMFDCYHVGVMQGDVLTRLRTHLPIIGHIQFAAVPSRAEPDEGELNYPAIFAEIDRLGYAGWVGAEYRPRADTDDGLGWFRASRTR